MLIKLDDISERLAKELNVDKYKLKEINRSQWKLLMDTMQQGDLKGVKIMYIGKFSKKLRIIYGHKRNISGVQKPNI